MHFVHVQFILAGRKNSRGVEAERMLFEAERMLFIELQGDKKRRK